MEGIGQTPPGWWTQRFMRYALAALLPGDPPTPQRVKRARGAEVDLRLRRGEIEARVTAGASVYTASLRVKPLGQRDWKRVLDAVAADPDAAQRLLAGQPGPELEALCAGVGVDLFPPPKVALPLRCSCHQWDCRHIVVLLVKVANLLAATPLLWLEVLGQPRAELLAAVRGRLADRGAGARRGAAATDLDPERFWATSMDPDSIRVRPGDAAAPDALLRRLGPLPLPLPLGTAQLRVEREVSRGGYSYTTWDVQRQPVDTVLRQYAAAVARAAAALAHGERPPAYEKEPLPGKAIPLATRVAAEVAEVALASARPLGLPELAEATPTAAALGPDQAYHAVHDALRMLPPDVTVLGGQVGQRAAFLAGARFRQVISFAEWRSGRLEGLAGDCLIALHRLGVPRPYAVQVGSSRLQIPEADGAGLFAQLQPNVGDELELQVIDPAEPLLAATLHRRAERSLAGRAEANARAGAILRGYMDAANMGRLSVIEAVGLLLGAGVYRQAALADPVWLLPAAGSGVYHAEGGGELIRESWYAWRPEFGRRSGGWSEQSRALSLFAAALAQAGWPLRELDPALRFIQRWCQYWTPAQDRPGEHPPARALLHFLWNVAPREAGANRVVAQRGPEVLATWFRFLGERHPAMAEIYQEHIVACEVPGAYEHRLQTSPRKRSEEAAWELEGYRWLGPDAYFT